MQGNGIDFSEVQSLYELCTFSTDLKKFCSSIGVNYDKYLLWQNRQRWDEEKEMNVESDEPGRRIMTEIEVVGIPHEDEPGANLEDEDEKPEYLRKRSDSERAWREEYIPSSACHFDRLGDGTPAIKGFDLRRTTLADVICAGRGLDAPIESFKLHMHDGLHMRHTHITLREAIVILHQLNIMYSC